MQMFAGVIVIFILFLIIGLVLLICYIIHLVVDKKNDKETVADKNSQDIDDHLGSEEKITDIKSVNSNAVVKENLSVSPKEEVIDKTPEKTLFHVEVTAFDRYIDFIVTEKKILFKSDKNYRNYAEIKLENITGIKYVVEARMYDSYGVRNTTKPLCNINDYNLFLKKENGSYNKINFVSTEAFIQAIDCLINVLGRRFVKEIATEFLHSGKCIVDGVVFDGIYDNGMYAYNIFRRDFTETKFYIWDDVKVVGNGEELAFFSISDNRKLFSLIVFERYNLIFLANAINAVRELKLKCISDLLKEL